MEIWHLSAYAYILCFLFWSYPLSDIVLISIFYFCYKTFEEDWRWKCNFRVLQLHKKLRLVIFLQSRNGNLISSSAGMCDLAHSFFVKPFSFGCYLFFCTHPLHSLCFMSFITYKECFSFGCFYNICITFMYIQA